VELLIAVGALAMSALFFVLAGRFPSLAADPGGLALFPRIVAVFTGLASAAFVIQVIRRCTVGRPLEVTLRAAGAWFAQRRVEVVSFAVVGFLPFAIQWIGFTAAIGVFTVLLLVISRVRLFPLAITALLTTAGVYVAYAIVLGAVLPAGQLWD
jgi:hypothetical protein